MSTSFKVNLAIRVDGIFRFNIGFNTYVITESCEFAPQRYSQNT